MHGTDIDYAEMPVNETIVTQKTADLRWFDGALQQRVLIFTQQSGMTVKSATEWQDIPIAR